MKWIKERRGKGGVTGKALKRLHKLYGNQSFKESDGWYNSFERKIQYENKNTDLSKTKGMTDDQIETFHR